MKIKTRLELFLAVMCLGMAIGLFKQGGDNARLRQKLVESHKVLLDTIPVLESALVWLAPCHEAGLRKMEAQRDAVASSVASPPAR